MDEVQCLCRNPAVNGKKKDSPDFSIVFLRSENTDIPLHCFIEVVIFSNIETK